MDVFALFSDQTAEKVLLDSFPARETEKGLILKTTISSAGLKESAVTSINNAYLILAKTFDDIPESIGVCVYGFSSSVTGNSADLAFASAFFAHIAKKGIVTPFDSLPVSIAATGVITERLSVERVGNIREKLLAAVEKRIGVVFYPFGNQNELEELKKTDPGFAAAILKTDLIPVKSLEDIFYEFGFIKSTDTAEKNSAGRKLPGALSTASVVLALLAVIIFAALNSGILKRNNPAGLLNEASTNTAPVKIITTPRSASATLLESAVKSTSGTYFTKGNNGMASALASPTPGEFSATSSNFGEGGRENAGKSTPKSNTVSASSTGIVHTSGNIPSNLMNSGFVAAQGDWIYYTDPVNVGLYRMKNDGSGVSCIKNAFATYINVSGDRIYYLDTRSRGLFIAGSGKIHDDNFGMISISGDWVYYLNKNDNMLYKVYKNGLDRTSLCGEFRTSSGNHSISGISCSHMCVGNDLIYFFAEFKNEHEEDGIYSMRNDGSDKRLITRDKCDMLCAEDGYIYFVTPGDRGLYRVKTDGTGKEKLHEGVNTFNLSSGLIYFATSKGLFKMNCTGDFISKLCNDSTDKINIVSDWIYYFNSNDANRLYRIRPNGTGKHLVGE